MAKEKEEKKVQPQVSKLMVSELVMYMIRPFKQLEEQFRAHLDEYKQDVSKQGRCNERVEGAFEVMQEELKRIEKGIKQAQKEAIAAMNAAAKDQELPEEVHALQDQLKEILEQVQIGELVRHEQKANARELDRLMKSINGCSQDLEKLKDHQYDVERQQKEKLQLHSDGLKQAGRNLEAIRTDLRDDKENIAKMLEHAGEDMKARQQNLMQGLEQNQKSLDGKFDKLRNELHQDLQAVKAENQQVVADVRERLSKFDEQVDLMSLARKDINLLERRMDKVVSVIKEMQAHFEFEG